jgi:hypothetical protein
MKNILHSYAASAWMPFFFVVFFLLIVSLLIISGGVHASNKLNHCTNLFIKLYAFSLLGQLYVSFWNFFGRGTRTGIIQLLLLVVSFVLSFLSFFFLLLPSWRGSFGV